MISPVNQGKPIFYLFFINIPVGLIDVALIWWLIWIWDSRN